MKIQIVATVAESGLAVEVEVTNAPGLNDRDKTAIAAELAGQVVDALTGTVSIDFLPDDAT